MATRYNPYALDPALSAGIGNLTKALIGSASDDAAIARGRASDALASYRQAQTQGQKQSNEYLQDFNESIATFLSNPDAVTSVFDTLGLKSPVRNIPRSAPVSYDAGGVDPGLATAMGVDTRTQNNVPFIERQGEPLPVETMRGLVSAILKGGVPGNPQQTSNMGLNIQELAKNELARNLLLSSNQTPDRIAGILTGQTLSKYFDRGSPEALTKIEAATDIKQTEIETGGDIQEEKIRTKGSLDEKILELSNSRTEKQMELRTEKEIADEKNKVETAYREFKVNEDNKTDLAKQKIINENSVKIEKLKLQQKDKSEEKKRELEKEIAELEEQTKLKIAKMKDDTVRFKFENEPVTITKKPGEKYVLDPKLGERLQIAPNDEGLFVIDGGIDNEKVKVKVGKDDIYLTKEHAKLLGIEPNESGQYVIEGAGFPDATMTDANKFDKKFKDDYESFADTENKLEPGKIGKLRAYLQKKVNDSDLPFDEAYNKFVIPVISAGNIPINPPGLGNKFNFPKFFADVVKRRAGSTPKASLISFIKSLGYNDKQAEAVYKEATG